MQRLPQYHVLLRLRLRRLPLRQVPPPRLPLLRLLPRPRRRPETRPLLQLSHGSCLPYARAYHELRAWGALRAEVSYLGGGDLGEGRDAEVDVYL